MKSHRLVEVIFYSKYSLRKRREKELTLLLSDRARCAIAYQQEKTKKLLVPSLKETPAIYMS